ncbi:MAG: PAS domain-containing protein [Planctomycetia bacterium]|nr:PAS domain-containing protein [Planctomycetia bacterium]
MSSTLPTDSTKLHSPPIGTASVSSEIKQLSDAKQADDSHSSAALQRKADLLQSILDSLADGLAAVDQTGRFTQFNPAGEQILGRGIAEGQVPDLSEAYGLFLPDGQTQFPHDELPLIRAMWGFRSRDVEMIVRNESIPEGRWLKVTAAPVKDERGGLAGGVVLFRDNTATKQMQQTLAAERLYLRHLIAVQDRDRTLTAYDLHDGIVQLMTGALLRLEACNARDVAQADAKHEDVTTATQLLRDALEEARRLVGGLSPPVIDELGVVGAIDYLVANHEAKDGLEIEFTHQLEARRFPAVVESTIFRIVQEALNNVVRHAATKRAAVKLEQRDQQLSLTVRDWGCGFEIGNRKAKRYGLRGIEERTRLLNGTIRIESETGRGTSIDIVLPTNPTPYDTNET